MKDKRVLLGISGGIAAYKAAILVRSLVKEQARVEVVLTSSASDFVTPLTLSTLTGNPVYKDFFDERSGEWVNHVRLAHWADVLLMAPLTANTLAKMRYGFCDNLLLATYLSATCPVALAPAMDRDMYRHTAVQDNLEHLKGMGHHIIGPEEGELASGLEGMGRMSEPETIVKTVKTQLLSG